MLWAIRANPKPTLPAAALGRVTKIPQTAPDMASDCRTALATA
jgi:hypothetical protein